MKTQKEIFQLCDQIRETAFTLHRYLRHVHGGNFIRWDFVTFVTFCG